jgi:hypothetical protein
MYKNYFSLNPNKNDNYRNFLKNLKVTAVVRRNMSDPFQKALNQKMEALFLFSGNYLYSKEDAK